MELLLKESGLTGLKGSIQFCAECQQSSMHFSVPNGAAICHACGYNADVMCLCEPEQPAAIEPLQYRQRWSA